MDGHVDPFEAFTQAYPACWPCWLRLKGSVRPPQTPTPHKRETCCVCQHSTRDGIYLEEAPETGVKQ